MRRNTALAAMALVLAAANRHVCLLQHSVYRNSVAHATMGHYQVPMLSYDLTTAEAGR